MAKITVKKTVIPVKAMACYDFTPMDYADAYQVQLKDKLSLNITELANHIFGTIESYPLYVRFLLRLRDLLVKPPGLLTARGIEKVSDQEGWIGFFRIYRTSKIEQAII